MYKDGDVFIVVIRR